MNLKEIITLNNLSNKYSKYKIIYALLFNYFNNYYKFQVNELLELKMINTFIKYYEIVNNTQIKNDKDNTILV